MSRMMAVKVYLEKGTSPIATSEFGAFWKVCSEAERQEFGDFALKALGETLTT